MDSPIINGLMGAISGLIIRYGADTVSELPMVDSISLFNINGGDGILRMILFYSTIGLGVYLFSRAFPTITNEPVSAITMATSIANPHIFIRNSGRMNIKPVEEKPKNDEKVNPPTANDGAVLDDMELSKPI